jgi:hypothetical protein
MGLLMSDTLLIDPTLDDTLALHDSLSAWTYALDPTCDAHEHETADLSAWPRLTFPSAASATHTDR